MATNRLNSSVTDKPTATLVSTEPTFWESLTPLEKVGTVALGVAGTVAVVAFLVPGLASAATGGALTASGAWFLKGGFGK
jgi:hypothetical protein